MTDLPGKAIYDYYFEKSRKKLFVHDTFGPKVEMPLSIFFRKIADMPILERKALKLCSGKVLDIGAGSGSHVLELQQKNPEIYALEISPTACEVMKSRGVQNVVCDDIFKYESEKFDTLLLLMNGIGISSTIDGFRKFLKKAEELLNEKGQIIFDSCDISYMYEDVEKPDYYYGEVRCRFEYDKIFTHWFDWLYIDRQTMLKIAVEEGWVGEVVYEDSNSQYLAVLKRNKD